jgi:arginase
MTEREGRQPLTLIGAPTSAGAYAPGQEDGPAALREHGLADQLRRLGAYVTTRAMRHAGAGSPIRHIAERRT